MEQFLGLQTWGTDVILWIQSFNNGFLDAFFRAITILGNPEGYLIFLSLIYWCINRKWGLRLLVLVMLSSWVNEVFKALLKLPRPDPARVRVLVEETSYGFPSNHAQTGAVIVWGYLIAMVRKGWFTVLAVAIGLLISLSRPYLGVHFPQDVIGGWVLGLVVLLLWLHYEERMATWWHRLTTGRQVAVAIAGPVLLTLLMPADRLGNYPNETAATVASILMGAGLGSILEQRTVRFRVDGSLGQRVLRYVVGMVLVGAVYLGGSLVPDLQPWGVDIVVRVLRYGLLGLVAIWFAPWLFVKLRLAESDLTGGQVDRGIAPSGGQAG